MAQNFQKHRLVVLMGRSNKHLNLYKLTSAQGAFAHFAPDLIRTALACGDMTTRSESNLWWNLHTYYTGVTIPINVAGLLNVNAVIGKCWWPLVVCSISVMPWDQSPR